MPFAIRSAKEIKIKDTSSKCTGVPIRVEREISQSNSIDKENQTVIQFFQPRIGLDRSSTPTQIASRTVIFTVGPSNWESTSNSEIELYIPICEEMLNVKLSELVNKEISLPFRYVYSTKYDDIIANIEPKCNEINSNRCYFYTKPTNIFGIKFSTSNIDIESVKDFYQDQIDNEREYLKSKPCDVSKLTYDKQSNTNILMKDNKAICESSQRNLDFLSSEITQLTNRSSVKPSPSLSVIATPTITQVPSLTPSPMATVSVLASPAPRSPSTMSSARKFTITCTKGKLTKKVTGVNPKCPTGYKKK